MIDFSRLNSFYAAKSRRQKLARLRQKLARFQKLARRTGEMKPAWFNSSGSKYAKGSSQGLTSLFD